MEKILLCCFYSPPFAGKNQLLVSHISDEVQKFLSHNPDSGGVVLSGDMNLMDLDTILTMDSSLRQIVTVPTRKDKILDVVVTNLGEF